MILPSSENGLILHVDFQVKHQTKILLQVQLWRSVKLDNSKKSYCLTKLDAELQNGINPKQ